MLSQREDFAQFIFGWGGAGQVSKVGSDLRTGLQELPSNSVSMDRLDLTVPSYQHAKSPTFKAGDASLKTWCTCPQTPLGTDVGGGDKEAAPGSAEVRWREAMGPLCLQSRYGSSPHQSQLGRWAAGMPGASASVLIGRRVRRDGEECSWGSGLREGPIR